MTKFFIAKVDAFNEVEVANGKTKIQRERLSYLVECESIPEAHEITKSICKVTYDDFEIKNVYEFQLAAILSRDDLKV